MRIDRKRLLLPTFENRSPNTLRTECCIYQRYAFDFRIGEVHLNDAKKSLPQDQTVLGERAFCKVYPSASRCKASQFLFKWAILTGRYPLGVDDPFKQEAILYKKNMSSFSSELGRLNSNRSVE